MVEGVGVTGVTVGVETGTLSWRKGMLLVGRRDVVGGKKYCNEKGRERLVQSTGRGNCGGTKRGAVHAYGTSCGTLAAQLFDIKQFIIYSIFSDRKQVRVAKQVQGCIREKIQNITDSIISGSPVRAATSHCNIPTTNPNGYRDTFMT